MRVSIITVTYNAEATLERTLKSVAQQTHPDIEHLIMDGASKDRTVEIARQYPHATVVSEPDKGLYDAMNKGLQRATGDYLCFLNAGDVLHSHETITHIVEVVEEAPLLSPQGGMNHPNVGKGIAVIYGDTHIVDGEGHFLRNRRLTPPEHLTWRSFKEGMLVCHQAFYINRQIAQPYDLTYKFSADFDWCIRCMKEGEQRGMVNHYLHEPLADYLAEGMTTANHQASLKERFRIMAKHYGLATTILQHIWFTLRVLVKR
ncbi:MAG: glycosyltransferase family 2 protein [Bacteroidaceae bacterium]